MQIHKFSVDGELEEMEAADLRSTLNEFMEQHGKNVEAVERFTEAMDAEDFTDAVETAASYSEQVDEQSETLDVIKAQYAEEVAEESPLFTAEELTDLFSLEDLMAKADTAAEFSEGDEEDDTDDVEEEDEPTFSEREQKSRRSNPDSEFASLAAKDAERILGGGVQQ